MIHVRFVQPCHLFPIKKWLINPLRDTLASIDSIDMDIETIWSMDEDDGWYMCVYLIMFLLIWNRVISIGNVLFVLCLSSKGLFFYCDNKSFIHVFPARRKGEVRARNTLQNMFVWQLIIWCLWHRKPFVLFYSRRKK